MDPDGVARARPSAHRSRTSAAARGDATGAQVSAHGSRAEDGVSLIDGLRIGNMYQSSNLTNMSLSPLLSDQVDIQLSGQMAETGTNGVIMNLVPRSGGNTFSGSAARQRLASEPAGQQHHRPAAGPRPAGRRRRP